MVNFYNHSVDLAPQLYQRRATFLCTSKYVHTIYHGFHIASRGCENGKYGGLTDAVGYYYSICVLKCN